MNVAGRLIRDGLFFVRAGIGLLRGADLQMYEQGIFGEMHATVYIAGAEVADLE
jgi:hypothetical protein